MLADVLTSQMFWIFCGVGFFAQLIDGALGMAYGVVCIAVLSALGVPPAAASAVVHAAEVSRRRPLRLATRRTRTSTVVCSFDWRPRAWRGVSWEPTCSPQRRSI